MVLQIDKLVDCARYLQKTPAEVKAGSARTRCGPVCPGAQLGQRHIRSPYGCTSLSKSAVLICRWQIFGTDISDAALERARQGGYYDGIKRDRIGNAVAPVLRENR
jgi:hypothetical protein